MNDGQRFFKTRIQNSYEYYVPTSMLHNSLLNVNLKQDSACEFM